MSRYFLLALVLLTICARADDASSKQMTDEQLVDALQSIKSETIGIDSLALVRGFIAEDGPLKFEGGVLGTTEPKVYPGMRILVQRGVKSLPVLLRHLDDARPTQLAVPSPGGIIMWSQMGEEYAPRVPATAKEKPLDLQAPEPKLPYTVKVGDVCFALVGQIVGRPLRPVRYQPTGGMIINSPVASAELARKVRQDWTGLTAADFLQQLVKDANASHDPDDQQPALVRLHYYYPLQYVREGNGSVKIVSPPGETK